MGPGMGMGNEISNNLSSISLCMFQISYVPCKRHGDVYVA
jgi:hypothetical protein